MAQHGYLREFDEGWDRGEERDQDWRDRESGWRGERDFGDRQRDRGLMFRGGDRDSDWNRARRHIGSSQDDLYLSWRDKQLEALDRDYEEYCREREHQFHQDFDSWRRQRQSNPPPLQTGMTQSGASQESGDTLELTTQAPTADPVAAATAGTTSNRTGRR